MLKSSGQVLISITFLKGLPKISFNKYFNNYLFFFDIDCENAPAIIPVGIAIIPIPLIEIKIVAIFPNIVIGYTSP